MPAPATESPGGLAVAADAGAAAAASGLASADPLPALRPARALAEVAADDLRACERLLAAGSKSFAAAARLLPARLRAPATAFYAFCRVADDAVDDAIDPHEGVRSLQRRLDRIFAGVPEADPVDRAFAAIVHAHRLPRAPVDALIDGFVWDAEGRDYPDEAALLGYCARVASAVGVVMTLFMGERRPELLARACDLGAAMQLTNIARDVGEDARRGRVYLPAQWLADEGLDAAGLLAHPTFSPALGRVVARVLARADVLYARADAGLAELPRDCRGAMRAASLIYADIGRVIAANGHDSVSRRAVTGRWRKLWLLLRAQLPLRPRSTALHDPPLAQMAFLVEAVAQLDGRPPALGSAP